jgi:hypothetical protein
MESKPQTADAAWRRAGLVIAAGLATGVLTQLGQSALPGGWSQAANSISPWLLVAFLVGAAMTDLRRAAVAGMATLVLALAGYDAMILIRFGYGPGIGPTIFWGLAALAGGPVFGAAGRVWRTGPHVWRAIALGLLASVGVAEGFYCAVVLSWPAVGAGLAIVGLAMPLILGRSRDDRIGAYVAAVPALGLGALGYLALTLLSGLTAGIT